MLWPRQENASLNKQTTKPHLLELRLVVHHLARELHNRDVLETLANGVTATIGAASSEGFGYPCGAVEPLTPRHLDVGEQTPERSLIKILKVFIGQPACDALFEQDNKRASAKG